MINHYLLDYMAAATIMTTATEKPTLYVDMELYFAVTVPRTFRLASFEVVCFLKAPPDCRLTKLALLMSSCVC